MTANNTVLMLVAKLLGPYQGAVLRFTTVFGQTMPPSIIFQTEIFHPLVTPLTLNTSAPDSLSENQTASSFTENRSLPGAFCLKHGFPEYIPVKRQTSSMPPDFCSELLLYTRSVFEEAAVLDSIPIECVGDRNAWLAWRSHRSLPLSSSQLKAEAVDEKGVLIRRADQWDWRGIWKGRVTRGIAASVNDSSLYARGSNSGLIRFSKLNREEAESVNLHIQSSH